MKFLAIFRFEWFYQIRRPWLWLFGAVLIGFAFLMTRDGSLAEALLDDFFLNSPFAIAKTTVVGSLLWLLIAATIAGEAAARDVATGIYPLTYTLPVSKAAYLGGRFLAAFVLNALLLLSVPVGILLAVYAPGVEGALIGPFRPAAYITAYVLLALPNAFLATAIQFWLANQRGRPMLGYLGSLLLFLMAYVVATFLFLQGRQEMAKLLDPIGVHFILSDLSHLWTTFEKNWRLLALEGMVRANRLLWIGIGLGALALTYLRFRFAHRIERSPFAARRARWIDWRRKATTDESRVVWPAGHHLTSAALQGDVTTGGGLALPTRQTLAIAWRSFCGLATSWAGLALLVVIPLLTILVVIDQMELNGVPLIPTTALVINELTTPLAANPLSGAVSRWVIIPLLFVFFAGELVWQEREAGLAEIIDAMPGSEWVPLLGKFLGLALVLVVFLALQAIAGIVAQLFLGYQAIEIGLYLQILFGLQLPEYLLFTVLALVVHVLVDQKYIGHLAAILAYVFIAMASLFGIEHSLLIYGAGPAWSYTEMRGFGPFLMPWLWFKLYWAAWALLLAVAARLLWGRGKERSFAVRLQWARRRLTGATAWSATVAVILILMLGGYIFYNTNVLNEYRTTATRNEQRAEYEQRYGHSAALPQPQLTGTTLHVELYPRAHRAEIRGTYQLVNRSAVAIDTIHLAPVPGVPTGAFTFDRPATLVLADERLGHWIYALPQPLQPGDALQLDFQVQIAPRGFRASGVDPAVMANGTYFTNGAWLPAIGYQRSRELINASDRRAYGLAPSSLIAALDDPAVRAEFSGPGGGMSFAVVIGTDGNEIAVAPGALRRTWSEKGRRYFEYRTAAPIGNEYAIFSAAYAVREAWWEGSDRADPGVTIQIFHHPQHTAHLDRMIRSIQASLDYYTAHFGPYPYGHLQVVERPGPGTGMHADAAMISHGEGFTQWNPSADPAQLDLPYAVVAHEVAHQWTLPSGFVEGAPVMSEGLAWYYAMQVVEETQGRAQLQLLLHFMRQPYPYAPIRRGEPLLRGLDPYMAYRKGPFALHALREYIGAAQVNTALRRLVEQHRAGELPLVTTLDLYRELQAVTPEPFHYLLHDLFEVNTFWELETTGATAEPREDGNWQVTLAVNARKVVVAETGIETALPMAELIQIGIFAPTSGHNELGEPLSVQLHSIRTGAQTITVTVPSRPALAGIDPYHLLDWEEQEDDDNIAPVELGAEGL